MQKARGQAFPSEDRHSPPTACKHTVSGTISLPSQGCFSPFPHGYWFTIGRQGVFSLTRWSSWIPAGFHVSRDTQEPVQRACAPFTYGAFTLYGRPFRSVRLSGRFVTRRPCGPTGPTTPTSKLDWFGLFRVRSPLLAESLTCFLFLQVLRWFTSLRSLPWPMYSARDNPGLAGVGCPIRESTGQSLFAAHRRLSQLTTPFIAF